VAELLSTINNPLASKTIDRAADCDFGSDLGAMIGKMTWRLRLAASRPTPAAPLGGDQVRRGDAEVRRWLTEQVEGGRDIAQKTDRDLKRLRVAARVSTESLIADVRYGLLASIMAEAVEPAAEPPTLADRLDRLFMHAGSECRSSWASCRPVRVRVCPGRAADARAGRSVSPAGGPDRRLMRPDRCARCWSTA
jgi:hypothetical protein